MAEPASTTVGVWATLKNLSYIGAVFISLNPEAYAILGIFMVVDVTTGVIRSGTIHGWRSITSHALSVGIFAKCTLMLVPFLLALAGHAVGIEITFVAKSALNMLILSELYSILSNIQSTRLRRDIQEFDAVNLILAGLRTGLEKTLKKP